MIVLYRIIVKFQMNSNMAELYREPVLVYYHLLDFKIMQQHTSSWIGKFGVNLNIAKYANMLENEAKKSIWLASTIATYFYIYLFTRALP